MNASDVDFDKGGGLVPVVVQDADSGAVLMLGYANRLAIERTEVTGRLHFWSRSRSELWLKGEKSGNYLLVETLELDCDGDAVLARVRPATGETPVCHTGADSCFHRSLGDD
ncbi:MAG TPA: phosphoribosyl-AMP cyclohydrolase [Chloroflexota bacterium]|nr:phosphoribosyl-AMP cyclohydrolase [Chloroflexota bacterium]